MSTNKGMLARLAESLYWIGRYVERADDTSRIVDAYVHRIVEDPFNDEDATCRSLFAILGIAPTDAASLSVRSALDVLVFDPDNPSAITGSLTRAFDNARRARDVISSEMWVCLNATHNDLAQREATARRLGAATYFNYVRDRTALFTGLSDSTMSRDQGWQFLVLGRSLERIDMTARLLKTRLVAADNAPDWLTLLRACGAMESFLRASMGATDPERIAEFLLLDRLFPRSAFHALEVAEARLEELSPTPTRTGVADVARRTITEARIRLEFTANADLLAELGELLDFLEATCAAANDAITARFFRQSSWTPWATEDGL